MSERDLLAEAMRCTTDEERRAWLALLTDEEQEKFWQDIMDFINCTWSAHRMQYNLCLFVQHKQYNK